MLGRFITLAVLLTWATPVFAAERGALSISVTVVRSIAVTTSGDRPSSAAVSVRAPDGSKWSAPVVGAQSTRALELSTRANSDGSGYVVVTVLADAASG